MKHIKLYNVIFPIWFLLFFPPVILLTFVGNLVIDSLVLVLCFFVFRLAETQKDLKTFYRNSILKVWLFGFLADFIGGVLLFVINSTDSFLGIPYEIISAINYDPFSQAGAVVIIACAMLLSAVLIFLFNYKFTFKNQIQEKTLKFKTSLTIAIITMPWTFLLPTKWFYNGF